MTAVNFNSIWEAYWQGVMVAFVISHGVNACNGVSVACGEKGISTKDAIRWIYGGRPKAEGVPNFSLWHFSKGWTAYMARELPRCSFKPLGAQFLMPQLARYFEVQRNPKAQNKVNAVFAMTMALCDLAVTPIDGARVRQQSGISWFPSLEEAQGRYRLPLLCQGAFANTVRQYMIWYTWALTKEPTRKWTQDTCGLSPATTGFFLQSLLQSVPITLASFPAERLKNHLQAHPLLQGRWRYWHAARQIVQTQGVSGIWKGVLPKIGATAWLVLGFNHLVRQGELKKGIPNDSISMASSSSGARS